MAAGCRRAARHRLGSNQFTPLLLVYRHALGVGTGTLEAMFGFHALGLIPGLLLAGPLSDARGRRNVVLAAAALSLGGSVVLLAGAHSVALLFAGPGGDRRFDSLASR